MTKGEKRAAPVDGLEAEDSRVRRYLLARGALTFLFGCTVIAWGGWDHGSLALNFFIYTLLDGLLVFIFSFFVERRGAWHLTADSVVSVLTAALTLVGPLVWSGVISQTGSIFLPYFMVGKFLLSGVLQLCSFSIFKTQAWRRTVTVTGIMSIGVAVSLLCLSPADRALSLVLGGWAVLIGLSFMLLRLLMPHLNRSAPE